MDEGRKRKSKFDILPTDYAAVSSVSAVSVLQSLCVQQSLQQSTPWTGYVSVVDQAFTDKLDRAMERNFEYIERYGAPSLA